MTENVKKYSVVKKNFLLKKTFDQSNWFHLLAKSNVFQHIYSETEVLIVGKKADSGNFVFAKKKQTVEFLFDKKRTVEYFFGGKSGQWNLFGEKNRQWNYFLGKKTDNGIIFCWEKQAVEAMHFLRFKDISDAEGIVFKCPNETASKF